MPPAVSSWYRGSLAAATAAATSPASPQSSLRAGTGAPRRGVSCGGAEEGQGAQAGRRRRGWLAAPHTHERLHPLLVGSTNQPGSKAGRNQAGKGCGKPCSPAEAELVVFHTRPHVHAEHGLEVGRKGVRDVKACDLRAGRAAGAGSGRARELLARRLLCLPAGWRQGAATNTTGPSAAATAAPGCCVLPPPPPIPHQTHTR
jgi:hypothetical protein